MKTQYLCADHAAASAAPSNPNTVRPVDSIEQVLRAAESRLQELMLQRAEIVRRIGAIKRTIVGVTKLCGDEILSENAQQILRNNGALKPVGLTDSCRRVLIEAECPLTARAICAELEKRGCTVLAHHKDPVASVTTILNRLARYGEASAIVEDGRTAWHWSSETQDALLNTAPIGTRSSVTEEPAVPGAQSRFSIND